MLAAGVESAETGRRAVGRAAAARFPLLTVSCSSTCCGMRANFQLRNFRFETISGLESCQLTDT